MPIDETRRFVPINVAVATVSDTRIPETDTSGDTLAARIEAAGHRVAARRIVRDDADVIEVLLRGWIAPSATWGATQDGSAEVTGATALPFGRLRSLTISTGDGRLLLRQPV